MKCKLYPYNRRDVISIQEIKQKIGWQISSFHIPDIWKITEGENVTIAVIDSGCDLEHQDLVGNLLDGYNVLNPKEPPIDDCEHGTHITGIICAANNDLGIVGVAPRTKIIPIKVLNADGMGNMKDVAKGIRHAIERCADIICLSLGSAKPLASVRKAIKAAAAKGIPCFCAGGNINKSYDALYPARYPETIAIAAIDKDYRRADFSNTSKLNLDFLAPGVEILSTAPINWYAIMSGSSMSVPFAASCAALVLSAKRKKALKIRLDTVEDYRNLFRNGIGTDKYQGDKLYQGMGILDPVKMIEYVDSNEELGEAPVIALESPHK